MSLLVIVEGQERPIESVILDQAGDRIALCTASSGTPPDVSSAVCYVENPLNIPPRDATTANYHVALFGHAFWPESRVLSIRDAASNYLGLAFSLQALGTGATTLTGDEYQNAYGFFALHQLCAGGIPGVEVRRTCDPGQTYSITDFYPPDTIVVVLFEPLWRESFTSTSSFTALISNALPCFALVGMHSLGSEINEGETQHQPPSFRQDALIGSTRLTLRTISPEYPRNPGIYLTKLLKEIRPFDQHAAFRFFLVYQLFELLMQTLYEQYVVQFRTEAQSSQYDDPIVMRELIDVFKHSLSERVRIRTIVDANPRTMPYAQRVRSQCLEIMRSLGYSDDGDPSTAIYRIRNVIFHSFTTVSSTDLSQLADDLMFYMCALSLTFRLPTVALRS